MWPPPGTVQPLRLQPRHSVATGIRAGDEASLAPLGNGVTSGKSHPQSSAPTQVRAKGRRAERRRGVTRG